MKISNNLKVYLTITVLVAFWCAGILAAPLFSHTRLHNGAEMLYTMYSRVCHQNDLHSFHLAGEKCGVCIRCSAIYFGFLVGLLLLPLSGGLRRMQIPSPLLLVAVMMPMLVDVLLQFSGLHISTTFTRLATGILFGGIMPWCIVPLLIEAYSQIHRKNIHS
jgi:uncharacterized membrane protein